MSFITSTGPRTICSWEAKPFTRVLKKRWRFSIWIGSTRGKKRSELRKQNKPLRGQALIDELDNYAQTGKEYTKVLRQIIEQNDLDEFEAVTIDDLKEKKELKL